MITLERFREIDSEIKSSIRATLDEIRKNNFQNYILYTAECDFNEKYIGNPKISPYIIDNRVDLHKDDTRISFLINFMKTYYTFPEDVNKITDDEYRIYIEFMVYCHVWESESYLKKLHRFTVLTNNEDYPWIVEVPEMGKHDFIRNGIRAKLEKCSEDLANIFKKGFHSSLRNAFAHSQFYITDKNIYLDTYKGQAWDIKDISFDNWSERFSYSILLCYHLLKESHIDRENIVELTGTDTFKIHYPTKDGKNYTEQNIIYRPEQNGFTFKI